MVQQLVRAIAAINDAAHAFVHDRPLRRRIFQSKNELISLAIERGMPGLRLAWQRQPDGEWLVLVTLDDWKCVHVPFERLSVQARMRVVGDIGPVSQEGITRSV